MTKYTLKSQNLWSGSIQNRNTRKGQWFVYHCYEGQNYLYYVTKDKSNIRKY